MTLNFDMIDIVMLAAMALVIWAWQGAAHRQSKVTPILALIVVAFALILLLKGGMSVFR